MSKRRLVDTNVIVRYLVQDHEKHAKAAGKLFEACDRGEIDIIVLAPVLAECVFVLESFYKHPRDRIAKVLSDLVTSPGIQMQQSDIHLEALSRYGATTIHFIDCIIAATAVAEDIAVATFDQDFKKFTDVHVQND
jgi:predicted nucleic-acid-binding protein